MAMRRLAALGIGVTALLVIAGIASHGRPLSASHGGGPTPVFFDYVFTTIVVFAIVMFGTVALGLLRTRSGRFTPPPGRFGVVSGLMMVASSALIAYLFVHSNFGKKLRELERKANGAKGVSGRADPNARTTNPAARQARLRWDEVALVALLVGGVLAVAVAGRRGRKPPRPWRLRQQEVVAMTLDESLDDLRLEPDLRKAIIAAYARMERALALAGLARNPAEAPFEYVGRALVSLDASSTSAHRLTALFEWAKFSHHDPDAQMRDEAIAALEAVRDDLRRPQELAA
jgi:hypothetical protein